MSANVLDRTREFGVLYAVGARPAVVRRIVVAEGVILAATSCVLAVVPTLALTAVLGNLFGDAPLPYRISALAAGIWITIAVLGACPGHRGRRHPRLPHHGPRSPPPPLTDRPAR